MKIDDYEDLAEYLGASVPSQKHISKAVFKLTDCGAWARIGTSETVSFGSIVEGVDWETKVYTVCLPAHHDDIEAAIKAVEREAQEIWNETHGCPDCYRDEVTGDPQSLNAWGFLCVDCTCPTCDGEGRIF